MVTASAGENVVIQSNMDSVASPTSTARALADPSGEFRFRDEQRVRFLAKRLKHKGVSTAQQWSAETILKMLKARLDESRQSRRRAFRKLQLYGSDSLSRGELRDILHTFNVVPQDEDFEALWEYLDQGNSGHVSTAEVLAKLTQLPGDCRYDVGAAVGTSTSLDIPDNLAMLKRTRIKAPELGRFNPAQVRTHLRHRLAVANCSRPADMFGSYDGDRDGKLTVDELRLCLANAFGLELRDADFFDFADDLPEAVQSSGLVDYARFLDTLGNSSVGAFDYTRGADRYRDHVEKSVLRSDAGSRRCWPQMQQCGHMGAFVGNIASCIADRIKHEHMKQPVMHYVTAKQAAAIIRAKLATAPKSVYKWFHHAELERSHRANLAELSAMFDHLGIFVSDADFDNLVATLTLGSDGTVSYNDFVRVFGADDANRSAYPGIDWGVSTVSNKKALDLGFTLVADKYLPRNARTSSPVEVPFHTRSQPTPCTQPNSCEQSTAKDATVLSRDVGSSTTCDKPPKHEVAVQVGSAQLAVIPPKEDLPQSTKCWQPAVEENRLVDECVSRNYRHDKIEPPKSRRPLTGKQRPAERRIADARRLIEANKSGERPQTATSTRSNTVRVTHLKMSDLLQLSPAFKKKDHLFKMKVHQRTNFNEGGRPRCIAHPPSARSAR